MERPTPKRANIFALALFAVCVMDLISTAIILRLGGREFNPIMNFVLNLGGIGLMAAVKILTVTLAVIPLELAKTKGIISEKRHRNYYLVVIFSYLGIYLFFFVVANTR